MSSIYPSAPPKYDDIVHDVNENMDNVSLNSNKDRELPKMTGLRTVYKVKLSHSGLGSGAQVLIEAKMTRISPKYVKRASLADAVQYLKKWNISFMRIKCTPRVIREVTSQFGKEFFVNMIGLKVNAISSPDSTMEDIAAVKKLAFAYLASAKKLSSLRLYDNKIQTSTVSYSLASAFRKKGIVMKTLVCNCDLLNIDLLDVSTAVETFDFQHDALLWIPPRLVKSVKAYAKDQEEYLKPATFTRLSFVVGRTRFTIGTETQEKVDNVVLATLAIAEVVACTALVVILL